MAKLGDICNINMGQSPESSTYNTDGNGLPFFQGNADFGLLHPIPRVWCSSPVKIAYEDDILISVRAPIGALNIANQSCCIGRGLSALTANENVCLTKYLWYVLQSKIDELNAQGTGSTFKAIGKKNLEELRIPLPPLKIQAKMTSILDKISNLLKLRRQQLVRLDELIKSQFIEMFGDPLRSPMFQAVAISEIGTVITGNTPSMKIVEYYDSNDIMFIKPSDISDNCVTMVSESESYFSEKARIVGRVFPGKSVLVTCIGTIGKVGVSSKESSCNQQINVIIPKPDMNYLYLAYVILHMRDKLREVANAPVVPIINKREFSKIEIPFPPINYQEQFATIVRMADKSKLAVQRSVEKLETLKASLMQEYFGGGG